MIVSLLAGTRLTSGYYFTVVNIKCVKTNHPWTIFTSFTILFHFNRNNRQYQDNPEHSHDTDDLVLHV